MSSKLFRKVALERMASPEQLDHLIQVTRPQGWLALFAVIFLLGAAGFWSVKGSIPTEALGKGILIRQSGVFDVVSTGGGQIDQVLVSVGDQIERGQLIATIRQEGLARQFSDARTRREALKKELEDLLKYGEEQLRLSSLGLDQEREALIRQIQSSEQEIALAEERVQVEEDLLADGLVTKQTLLTSQQRLNDARSRLDNLKLQKSGLELKKLETEQSIDRQVNLRERELQEIDLQLKELEASLDENIRVTSPYSGTVFELMADRGDMVGPGVPILNMELRSEELVAVLFVPAEFGKQAQEGMQVRVSPTNVKQEEYGYMLGTVSWVAEFPSTSRGMTRLLGNSELVSAMMEKGPPVQIDVTLNENPETPTGYAWSSSTGPDVPITSGTVIEGSVVIRQVPPLQLLIPTIKETLGV
ncbi:MAG: NHLP bacteriocin system secretion protein [Acidobacteriota bacterium]